MNLCKGELRPLILPWVIFMIRYCNESNGNSLEQSIDQIEVIFYNSVTYLQ